MFRRGMLSTIVALLAVSAARADVILTYHLSSFAGPPTANIPNNLPLGAPISSLTMNVGDIVYLQVAISGTAPVVVGQANWNVGNGLVGFGLQLNYPSFIAQPFVTPAPPPLNQNFANARSQLPFATGHPGTFPGYNMGATAISGLDLATGLEATAGILSPTVIATFKIVCNSASMGFITMNDLNPSPITTEFGLSDGTTNLDPIIFAPGHASYPLLINSVPEPSSFVLAGLVLPMFVRRARRWRSAR